MLPCVCDDAAVVYAAATWNIDDIVRTQKVSDFLIALAYFSIPLELFYFVSCASIFPFRWVLTQFAAFIVLCGLTHLFTALSYVPISSFSFVLTLTVLKALTALVSCSTSITFVSLIPQMLKVLVREGLLMKKTKELRREVGLMKRQKEASWHVRMLTREIRRSLDRHTILYTTLVELAKVLCLENCSIWVVDESNSAVVLSHELKRRDGSASIPVNDPELAEIFGEPGVRILGFDSSLRRATGDGAGAAIRLPMLRVSNFKGGTPEMLKSCYAVLVLVLPKDGNRVWSSQELEIVENVADQVAVALSHASVLEESVSIREKLMEQNIALQKARQMALMANEAMWSFRKVMSHEMIKPGRSISAILSVFQVDNWRSEEQRRIVDTMAKGGLLLSALIEDATGVSGLGDSRIELKSRGFSLQTMLKDVVTVSKLLYGLRGLNFKIRVSGMLPNRVIGDETRILQAVLYMVGKVSGLMDTGTIVLHVCAGNGSQQGMDANYHTWKQQIYEGLALLKFEVCRTDCREEYSSLMQEYRRPSECRNNAVSPSNICHKLAKLMHGTASTSPSSPGLDKCMNLTIRLPIHQSEGGRFGPRYMDPEAARCLLKGMKTLLADIDGFNTSVTRKLLANLGCYLTVVSSWRRCLETLQSNINYYHLLLIDLSILEEDRNEVRTWIEKLRVESWLLVVALTSRSDSNARSRCLQIGIHGVICKPIILQEMEDELQRIFKQTRVHSPPFLSIQKE